MPPSLPTTESCLDHWTRNLVLHGLLSDLTLRFAPDGNFLMAGRQAQGTWNAALFAYDGKLLGSLDTKSRVTRAAFRSDAAFRSRRQFSNGGPAGSTHLECRPLRLRRKAAWITGHEISCYTGCFPI